MSEGQIRMRLGAAIENGLSLDSQMRAKGGKAYLDFIRTVLEGKHPRL